MPEKVEQSNSAWIFLDGIMNYSSDWYELARVVFSHLLPHVRIQLSMVLLIIITHSLGL